MPVPVKAPTPRPAVPTVAQLPDRRRQRNAMDPGPADVVRARTLLGNAAVTATLGGAMPGAQSRPSAWTAQMMLAGQNLVGNQAIANQAMTPAAPATARPATGTPATTAPPTTTPAATAPAPGMPATATPPTATPATGVPATGVPAVGVPVPPGVLAPLPPVPAPPPPQKPPPAKPTGPKTEAPPANPDKKDQAAQDKSTEERPDKGAKKEKGAGPRSPGADPKFQALKKDVNTKKTAVGTSHPPATAEAGAAQSASVPPADDQEARGKVAHTEDMAAAEPKAFDKQAFVDAVKKAIADRAPKNLEEADEFGGSGKAEEVKAEVQGKVGEGKDASAKEIADTTAEVPQPAPDAKEVVPMAPDKVPGKPGAPNPNQAAPDALPPSATDLSAGPERVNDQMASAQVTEQQLSLENSREPKFDKAVRDKKEMDAHSAAAPKELRADESRELNQTKKTAATQGTTAMAGIHATRVTTGQQVGTGKTGTKSKDEDKRKQVTALLQEVFDQTKSDVEKILSDLDKKVDRQFTEGEKLARDRFTAEHENGMARYKAERYNVWNGAYLWAKDKLFDLPEEANRIYERARDNYLAAMDRVITDIAGTVERELNRAKDRIAAGRKELTAAVDKLPADLRAIGQEAATEFEGRFDELKDTVNDKGSDLVDTLATRYTDAVKSVDEEIAAEKEKNKGLVTKAAEAIGDVIETIKELGRLLLGVLRKAASAIGLILKDPIGFLGNLVTGVGGGLKLFGKNAGRHLEAGVLAWLLGTGVTAGLQLPTSFDILGILVMIAAMLGISWPGIRSRLARRVPNQALVAAETAVPIVAQVKRRGVAGMWDDLKTRVGDLKKTLIKDLVGYLLPTIIIAGITWIASLFNPASAFIRACKMIIDIVRFIVTNARQIIDFVNAVLDAIIAIARGGTGGVPALVERALAKSIPVLIGLLAAILGIGGLAGKVKQIFQKIARPVNRAIDAVINKIVGLIKKLWQRIKPKKPRKAKPGRKKPPTRPKKDSRKKKDDTGNVAAGLRDARALVRAKKPVKEIKPRLPGIRRRHQLSKLDVVSERIQGTREIVHFVAAASPEQQSPSEDTVLSKETVEKDYGILIENQEMFKTFAKRRKLVIDVRPTNKDSVPHLQRGALYKPVDIKAKTINDADVLLRVAKRKRGLVGFFVKEPPMPRREKLGPALYAKAMDRREMRSEERGRYGTKMAELAQKEVGPGRFEVIAHVVHGYDKNNKLQPIAGDHDLYDIRRPNGSRLTPREYRVLIRDMQKKEFGVMHGAVVYWDPTDPDERNMKRKLVAQHQRDGDEGLVRFAPGQEPKYVVAETPL